MYYEQNPKRQRKVKRRRGCLSRVFRLALVLVVIWAALTLVSQWVGWSPFSGNLSVNASLPRGTTNILLMGVDSDATSSRRSDSMMIASFTSDGIKLTSIMRDTMVDVPGSGSHKINAAYSIGGANLSMRTVNQAFAMNITRYAAIDFQGIARVIDAMGGIELTITKAERDEINTFLRKAYKKQRVFNGVLMTPLTDYGDRVHLSGTHAMAYSRIRSIDSDYKRAERQRLLLGEMVRKLQRTKNPITLANVAGAILQCTKTNLNFAEMAALGVRALSAGPMQQYRVPVQGTYSEGMSGGVWSIKPDLAKNRELLRRFIYG